MGFGQIECLTLFLMGNFVVFHEVVDRGARDASVLDDFVHGVPLGDVAVGGLVIELMDGLGRVVVGVTFLDGWNAVGFHSPDDGVFGDRVHFGGFA